MSVKVVVAGANGRMGQSVIKAVDAHEKCVLHGALSEQGHAWVGRDLGEAMGGMARGVIVQDDPLEVLKDADVLIDFTAPISTVRYAQIAAQARIAHIIGTTGMTDEDIAKIDAAGRHAVIVRAGNMSLGLNLLAKMTERVAQVLGEEFDIEVIESHHNQKVDAPSGTALMLGEAAAAGRGIDLATMSDRARDGITGKREKGRIGFHAIRGGDIIGEHDVLFAGTGERIVLRHIASDRQLFAQGALRAALWAQNQKPGHYDMYDVLGL